VVEIVSCFSPLEGVPEKVEKNFVKVLIPLVWVLKRVLAFFPLVGVRTLPVGYR
jgi:hypothetical protein